MEQTPIDKPCPWCTRTGGLSLGRTLRLRPLGSFSLSGGQLKASATERAVLACSLCAVWITGYLDQLILNDDGRVTGGHFVADGTDDD